MTPGARVAAAIEILDDMASGAAAEQALTRWTRRSRFAGSKDRAAIRDHVFDVLRRRATAEYLGKGQTGRALMIGLLKAQGADLEALFDGQGHAPAPLTTVEKSLPDRPATRAERLNLPDWLLPLFDAALGDDADNAALALQNRAPVTLRVNLARASVAEARQALLAEGIQTVPNPLCDWALNVTDGARKVRQSNSFASGLVEFQDAASQAVIQSLPGGGRVLDYCAGGGGKALALAMDASRVVFAHDIDPARMQDLPVRAARAGAVIKVVPTSGLAALAPFDLVLCDAPCSGSGAWRRTPEGKWRLTPARLAELNDIQDTILRDAAGLVAPGGMLAYATCSVLRSENHDRIAAFLVDQPDWICQSERQFEISADGDGFFIAHLTRPNS